MPAAGFIYSTLDYPIVDVSNGVVTKTGTYGGFMPTVGIKTYILNKAFLLHEKSIFKSKSPFWQGMFFVYTGVSFPKPTVNYNLGVGIDLVSGFSLNLGLHVAQLSQPVFNQGKFSGDYQKKYSGGLYVGLTLDPSVITSVIKIFKP